MAAGDLLEAPGDVEWDGVLWSAHHTDSGYWYTRKATVEGWDVRWMGEDLPTEVGGAPGFPVPEMMYPTIGGLVCESAELVVALFESMTPTLTPAPLCWWDHWTDRRLSGMAVPINRAPHRETGSQILTGRPVDVQFKIGRPLDIEDLDES